MRSYAWIASIVVGALLVVGGVVTWVVVSTTLSDQKITVSDDAELEQDDPLRETASTASFLQASLFTSVVAFGVAAMAVLIGILFILLGLGMRDVATRLADRALATSFSNVGPAV
jgi:hypothetical protein